MKFSSDQIERLGERVFEALRISELISFSDEYEKEKDKEKEKERETKKVKKTQAEVEDTVLQTFIRVLEDDNRSEDRLNREAERLVQQQIQVAKTSSKTVEQLVEEVRSRLARSKRQSIDDGPDRCDDLAEKIYKTISKFDGVDFFAEERKIQNFIAHCIYRFRIEDEKLLEKIEELATRKVPERYSQAWFRVFDKLMADYKAKVALAKGTTGAAATPSSTSLT